MLKNKLIVLPFIVIAGNLCRCWVLQLKLSWFLIGIVPESVPENMGAYLPVLSTGTGILEKPGTLQCLFFDISSTAFYTLEVFFYLWPNLLFCRCYAMSAAAPTAALWWYLGECLGFDRRKWSRNCIWMFLLECELGMHFCPVHPVRTTQY